MAKRKRSPVFVVIPAFILDCVDDDNVLNLEFEETEEEREGPLSQIDSYPADDVLTALRKAFTLTFPKNPFVAGLKEALNEIKRACIEGIKTQPELLAGLKLKPMPFAIDDPLKDKTMLFKHVFVETKHLRLQVKFEGKRRSLIRILDAPSGDGLITAIRHVISDTFTEAHDEDEYEEILIGIRKRIWSVLPAFNDFLDEIEVERIADISDDD